MCQLGGALIPITTLLTLDKPDLNIFLQSKIAGSAFGSTQGDLQLSTEEDDEEEDNADALASGEQVVKKGQPVSRSFFPWSSVIRRCVSSRDVPGDTDDDYLTLCTRNKGNREKNKALTFAV